METIEICCPHCNSKSNAPSTYRGHEVQCPNCNQLMAITLNHGLGRNPPPKAGGHTSSGVVRKSFPIEEFVKVIAAMIICGFLFKTCGGLVNHDEEKSFQQPLGLLPAIITFLETHNEYGNPTSVQDVPDWAKGQRQRVQFTSGRNLLFYTKDGSVRSVYEDSPSGIRNKIWGMYETEWIEKETARP